MIYLVLALLIIIAALFVLLLWALDHPRLEVAEPTPTITALPRMAVAAKWRRKRPSWLREGERQ